MSLSLHAIAQGIGGRVHGNKVVAPGPEAANKKGYKRRKRTLTVWINGDGDIGVNTWRGQDPIATKDWVRVRCGLPAWAPRKRKLKPLPPLWERNQFLAESLKIARARKRVTFEQFALIINDLKNASFGANPKSRAALYAREFGFTPAETDAAIRLQWRSYTAAERAAAFAITYDEYRRLGLRRSGCIEHDPAERRRLTKLRYNAKRRVERAANRLSKSAIGRAPLCPIEKAGTVRVPSSEAVVGLVGSRGREPELGFVEIENHHSEKIGAFRELHSRSSVVGGVQGPEVSPITELRMRRAAAMHRPLRARTSIGEAMSEEMSVEDWLAIRKEEGLKIDPATAEVDWGWRRILDPYEVLPDLPPECDCAGRVYFARRPGSKIWVEFNDLPDNTCAVLWERMKSGLTKFDDEVPWA